MGFTLAWLNPALRPLTSTYIIPHFSAFVKLKVHKNAFILRLFSTIFERVNPAYDWVSAGVFCENMPVSVTEGGAIPMQA